MQILINGLISGSTIALLALAFATVYLPTRVFHIALAGVFALAPYLLWACGQNGWPWPTGIAAALLGGIGLSFACELFNHAPLDRKRAGPGLHLVSSLGICIVIVQVVALTWGNEVKVLRQGIDSVFTCSGVVVTRSQLLAGSISLIAMLGFYSWLRFSNLGLQFRALADNPTQLALFGYNTRRLRLFAFALAGLLAALSSLLTAFDIGFDPQVGLHALILAIVAVIIGGRDSFLGSVIAGFFLGILRSQVVWHLSARWQDAVTFGVLVVFLFFLPNGLLGRKMRLEAQT
jgi:branched-chain amino acid transport system permease protein